MRLSLRSGEKLYVNGAVLRVDRKVSLELLNDATFLLETHVMQPEEATTVLKRLYFAVQTMMMAPHDLDGARALFERDAAGVEADRAEIARARTLVSSGRYFEALKLLRGALRGECERAA